MVDGSGLENRRTRKGTGGSNPSLSAMLFVISKLQIVIPTLIPRMRVRIPSVNLPMRRPKPENEGKLGP